MSNAAPPLSVLMPVYNAAGYLQEALNSLWSQTMDAFEVIAVEDGSTDGSAEFLQKTAKREPRLKLITQNHGGVTRALNAGLAHARGEFIARMDADDVCEPNRFQRQHEALQADPQAVVIGSALTLIDGDGDRIGENPYPISHEQILERLLCGRNGFSHPAVMMRTEALRRVGGYRSAFAVAQDFDLWLRLSEVGRLANLAEPLLRYRLHGNSIGATRAREQHAVVRQSLQEYTARTGVPTQTDPAAKAKTINHQQAAWAKWALRNGEHATARKHAAAVLRRRPWWASPWVILWRSRRGT